MSYSDFLNRDIPQDVETSSLERENLPFARQFAKQHDFTLDKTSRQYGKQFYSMYQYRLSTLKKRVDEHALAKWGHSDRKVDGQTIIHKEKILDITSGQLCWVSGTVFSDMKNKLNILKDVENGRDDVLPSIPNSYVEGDQLPIVMLEDESGRAVLHNEEFLRSNILVTGCIIAVLGIEIQAGIFEIMDVVYPSASPQRPLSLSPPSDVNRRKRQIAIVSGLDIKTDATYDLRLELLKQYISGQIGSEQDSAHACGIAQLIIAGNSVASIEESTSTSGNDGEEDFVTTNNYGSKNVSKFNPDSLLAFSRLVNDLIATVSVSIMPGDTDPVEINLPQQPFHPSLLGSNKHYANSTNLIRLTNPSWFEIDNCNDDKVRILGTSGQNVTDILRYLPVEMVQRDEIITQIMEASMKWQNVIPTAPDTLYCHPFDNFDPFLLADETPHVYFVGNQRQYRSELVKFEDGDTDARVRVVSIPRFSETGEIVLLDADTLETEVVKIAV